MAREEIGRYRPPPSKLKETRRNSHGQLEIGGFARDPGAERQVQIGLVRQPICKAKPQCAQLQPVRRRQSHAGGALLRRRSYHAVLISNEIFQDFLHA